MDAVGTDRVSKVDPVVDDQIDAGVARQLAELLAEFVPLVERATLLAELDRVDAAVDSGLNDGFGRPALGERLLCDEIRAPLIGGHGCDYRVHGKPLAVPGGPKATNGRAPKSTRMAGLADRLAAAVATLYSRVATLLARLGIIERERLTATADLAWPRVITGFAIMSKQTADLAMVGSVLGAPAVAGLAFAGAYWTVGKFVAIGLAGGTVGLVPQTYRRGGAARVGGLGRLGPVGRATRGRASGARA